MVEVGFVGFGREEGEIEALAANGAHGLFELLLFEGKLKVFLGDLLVLEGVAAEVIAEDVLVQQVRRGFRTH